MCIRFDQRDDMYGKQTSLERTKFSGFEVRLTRVTAPTGRTVARFSLRTLSFRLPVIQLGCKSSLPLHLLWQILSTIWTGTRAGLSTDLMQAWFSIEKAIVRIAIDGPIEHVVGSIY
jgi:hypothetical protein